MNTIYQVVKQKTNIKGFWKGEKKLYLDNIKQVDYTENIKKDLFSKGEEAIFYTENNCAIVEHANSKKDVLRVKRVQHVAKFNRALAKTILKHVPGFTVYRNKTLKNYTIEIWEA